MQCFICTYAWNYVYAIIHIYLNDIMKVCTSSFANRNFLVSSLLSWFSLNKFCALTRLFKFYGF